MKDGTKDHRTPQLLRMQLNIFYSGRQAWLLPPPEHRYLADEGPRIKFTEGDTAANTVSKMPLSGFNVGYRDINALNKLIFNQRAHSPYQGLITDVGKCAEPGLSAQV
ncbi:hypothetical protein [Polaromonas sp.]|uniref:hypothetical protein n=1 Tax=Polaromonas sp. TaxID=1869339 RepID=UPI0017BAD5E6|nr:hypothetical protein [Polaromonas sp.]NML87416.1 hypothetical protein [Polaromonas sp.]